MDRFGYARTTAQLGALVLLLLSASAQAGGLFAPKIFNTAPPQSATSSPGANNNLYKAALQPALVSRQQHASRITGQWITGPTDVLRSVTPLPPRLRF
jgi:hypothetical protein